MSAFLPSIILGLLLAFGALIAGVIGVGRTLWRRRAQVSRVTRAVTDRVARSRLAAPLLRHRPRWLPHVLDRLTRDGYLGLHLLAGMLASVAALALFGAVAQDVLAHGELRALDLPLAQWLHEHTAPRGVAQFRAVTWLGSVLAIALLTLVVALPLGVRGRYRLLAGWLAANAGAGVLVLVLKATFRRDRPSFADPYVYEPTSSFPSGHALGSIVAYGMVAYLLATLLRSFAARTAAIILGGFLVLAIGISRLYLGAHYLTDVLAGYAAGAVWLTATITALRARRP